MSDETDTPQGNSRMVERRAGSVDVVEREKQAVAAKQYAAQRFNDYVTGFTQPPEYGVRGLFRRLGRGIDWR